MTPHATWLLDAKVLDAYVRNLRAYALNEHLREYEAVLLPDGAVDAHASAYARAYRVKGPDGSFACLRFWMNTAPTSIIEAYAELERAPQVLRRCGLSQVRLLNDALINDGQVIPAVLMDWAEGRSLSDTISLHINNKDQLLRTAEALRSAFSALNEHRTSHGDLRSSNILVAIEPKYVQIRLIDLDSLRWLGGPTAPRVVGGSGRWHEIWQRESVSPLESDYLDQAMTYLTVIAVVAEKGWWKAPTDGFLFQHLGVDLKEVLARVEQMNGTPAARVASAVKSAIEMRGFWNEVADVMRNPRGEPLTETTFWNAAMEGRVSRTKKIQKAPTRPARKLAPLVAAQYVGKVSIKPRRQMTLWLWILVLVTIAVITGLVYREEISLFLTELQLLQ